MQNKFNFIPSKIGKIHFLGVLGASLSSLALIAKKRGYEVSGSDTGENTELIQKLLCAGISFCAGHRAENIGDTEALVYSAAIDDSCPELCAAKEKELLILSRAEFLGGVISEYAERIGVAGTHGKSTVSGMLTEIFLEEQRDVIALIGAESKRLDGNYRLGGGDTVIYEACEYDRSFLKLLPSVAVVTNVEKEHVDCYPELSDAVVAYNEYIKNARIAVLDMDNVGSRRLGENGNVEKIYFSVCQKNADLYTENIRANGGFYSFDAVCPEKDVRIPISLSVAGRHNVSNALAAATTALYCGISPESVKKGLEGFLGMKRRMEYIGRCADSDVYDDYAHHPTEIKATLDSMAALGYKKIVCAFQPHTYSRTAAFFEDFTKAFGKAHEVVFTDIFAAREENVYGVSAEALAAATENGIYIPFSAVAEHLKNRADKDTVLLTVGAGRLNEVARSIIRKN